MGRGSSGLQAQQLAGKAASAGRPWPRDLVRVLGLKKWEKTAVHGRRGDACPCVADTWGREGPVKWRLGPARKRQSDRDAALQGRKDMVGQSESSLPLTKHHRNTLYRSPLDQAKALVLAVPPPLILLWG